jgi:hypothetical protein
VTLREFSGQSARRAWDVAVGLKPVADGSARILELCVRSLDMNWQAYGLGGAGMILQRGRLTIAANQ